MKKYLFIKLLFLLGILLSSGNALGAACTWFPFKTHHYYVPLLRSQMTIPANGVLAPGTIIYRQKLNLSLVQEVLCKEAGKLYERALDRGAGCCGQETSFTNFRVMKTRIPGLVYYFNWNGQPLQKTTGIFPEFTWERSTAEQTVERFMPGDWELVLMWIGGGANYPVGTLLGSDMGRIDIWMDPYYDTSGNAIIQWSDKTLWSIYITGALEFKSATCNTPDVTVNLGDHKIGRFISGEVSEMGRKAFNFSMQCPINYGYNKYNPSDSEKYIWDENLGTVQQTPNIENGDMKISFRAFDTLDTDRWIAKANPSDQSDSSKLWAEGVGVALYHSGGVRYRFDETQSLTVAPIRSGGTPGIINVPLEAAFTYDTSKPVSLLKPGDVNVAIEAVIQYN